MNGYTTRYFYSYFNLYEVASSYVLTISCVMSTYYIVLMEGTYPVGTYPVGTFPPSELAALSTRMLDELPPRMLRSPRACLLRPLRACLLCALRVSLLRSPRA